MSYRIKAKHKGLPDIVVYESPPDPCLRTLRQSRGLPPLRSARGADLFRMRDEKPQGHGTSDEPHSLRKDMRLIIRGTLRGRLQFQERVDIGERELDNFWVAGGLGEKHATAMADGLLDMIEIEFLDERNPNERFFRIGLNPAGMVWPIEIDLSEES